MLVNPNKIKNKNINGGDTGGGDNFIFKNFGHESKGRNNLKYALITIYLLSGCSRLTRILMQKWLFFVYHAYLCPRAGYTYFWQSYFPGLIINFKQRTHV